MTPHTIPDLKKQVREEARRGNLRPPKVIRLRNMSMNMDMPNAKREAIMRKLESEETLPQSVNGREKTPIMKLKEYHVVEEKTPEKLITEVNNCLWLGWELAGGIEILRLSQFERKFFQALVRDVEP